MASGPGVDWRVGLVDPTTGVPVTGFPSTVADGANVVEGATTDAAVGDASGTLNAHLRQTAKALAGGLPAALVGGRLSVDGSGVTQPTSAASGQFVDGAIATLGTNADAAVGDATGTLNAHLRQTAKALAGGLPAALVGGRLSVDGSGVTQPTSAASGQFVDGAIATLGANADAAVGDASGTLNAHLRQVAKSLAGTLMTTGADTTASGSLAAGNAAATLSTVGMAAATFQIATDGTWNGTLTFEASNDNTIWDPVDAINVSTGLRGQTYTTANTNAIFRVVASGLAKVRVRASTYVAGTATVTAEASVGALNYAASIQGIQFAGSAVASAPVVMGMSGSAVRYLTEANSVFPSTGNAVLGVGPGVWDATNWQKMLGDTSGRQIMVGAAASGAAVAGNPVYCGGSDGTNAQPLKVDTSGRSIVVGAAAAGAAVAGNPVRVGVSDGTNAQDCKQPATNQGSSTLTGILCTAPMLVNGTTSAFAQQNAAIGDGGGGNNIGSITPYLWNGGSMDRLRNNVTAIVQASTLTTAQTINTDIVTYNARSIMVHANVSNYNGGSINMKLQWKDANGLFTDIPGATTGTLTSGADAILAVGPTVWPANTATAFYVNYFLPRLVRLVTVIATASVTFSQSYDLPTS